MKSTEYLRSQFEAGRAVGARHGFNARAVLLAAMHGDEDLPDMQPDAAGLFFWAGVGGHDMPRWVQAVRAGKISDRDEWGRSWNFRDNHFEPGTSVLQVVGDSNQTDGTFELFHPGVPRVTVEGWLSFERGTDGEPLLVGAVQTN